MVAEGRNLLLACHCGVKIRAWLTAFCATSVAPVLVEILFIEQFTSGIAVRPSAEKREREK